MENKTSDVHPVYAGFEFKQEKTIPIPINDNRDEAATRRLRGNDS